ncbi:MAG TPA: hypothetical protein VHW44_19955 [Pseudonocardiaceae bacterium]|jgi:hypothetical protein|nr:hypothetical protein [Pseudonocardiaceae bacterium]
MDIRTIDQNYEQLQQQSQQTVAAITTLAQKLQTAAGNGDESAREWLYDLKEITLGFQQEQNQMTLLLQAIHNYVANQEQQQSRQQQQAQYQQPQYQQPQPVYQQPMYQQPVYQQPGYGDPYYQQQGGGFGRFMHSGFGQAIAAGAGLAIGEDIINDIF